ncbi:MAG: hypothetical protein II125_02605, partial [Ruminococcus sp.]|nr:hypothetical protein [Ruminococcus sp.]
VLLLPFCVQSRLGTPSDTLNDSFTVHRSGPATFETIGECLKRTLLDLRRHCADRAKTVISAVLRSSGISETESPFPS